MSDSDLSARSKFPVQAINTDLVPIDLIKNEMAQFLKVYAFNPTQVCLNDTGQSSSFDPYQGVGTAFDYETRKLKFKEKDFTRWAPELQGSEILIQIEKLKSLGFSIGRTRFMLLKPRSCYSFHQDFTERIHFVIEPDPQAFLLFWPNTIFKVPCDQRFHLVDTTRSHSAMNGGTKDRIHLVISLGETD